MSESLLDWYARCGRDLPWRAPAGVRPDPYRVWLSEIMLQQTTVAAVRGYFHRFTARWPDVAALAGARDDDVMAAWAGLGYYARARNLLKCARAVAGRHGGHFPDTRAGLIALPGIGPYTAAAIAAIAFGRAETVVDGNVERVMARLHAVAEPLPGAKKTLRSLAAELTPKARPGDHAQALMDLGATVCTPRNPACEKCPWRGPCSARAAGLAAELPKRARRAPKPVRLGVAFVGRRGDGSWLMERRPPSGLLGGTLGWPGSEWREAGPRPTAPGETRTTGRSPGAARLGEVARHEAQPGGTQGNTAQPGGAGASGERPGTARTGGPDRAESLPDAATAHWPEADGAAPPVTADWHLLPGEVRHTFTHFHLRLRVFAARLPGGAPAGTPDGPAGQRREFIAAEAFRTTDLPTLMRKVHDLARGAL